MIRLSALTGEGLALLHDALWEMAGGTAVSEAPFIARSRHVFALEDVHSRLQAGLAQLANDGAELCCEELRAATRRLGEMTGEWTTEDLLGAVFSTFCIGK